MKFTDFIKSPKPMTESEAKIFIDSHSSKSYQLVDVRQPGEYEQDHIPGAKLVPLNLLTEGGGDLDPEKPTIVYCQSGGRSKAAAQYLSGRGFSEVYDIGANIQSWMGIKAVGDYELSLDLINPDVDFPDALSLAYAMENGLQNFYLALEKEESREEFKTLYKRLAGFEDLHKERLLKEYSNVVGGDINPEQFLNTNKDVIEGGEIVKNTPVTIASQMKELVDILGLGMAIEAQSLDLYSRMAIKSNNEDSKKLFLDLADEEKQHLNFITAEMNKHFKN